MPIDVLCPGCEKVLHVPSRLAGKCTRCTSCRFKFRVPPKPVRVPSARPSPARVSTAAPSPDDPFSFTSAPSRPLDDQPGDDDEPASDEPDPGWEGVNGGLGNVWMGTVCLVGALIIFALIYVISMVSGGLIASDQPAPSGDEAQPAVQTTATMIRVLILVAGGLFILLTVSGGALRLFGFLRTTQVPPGTGAKIPAWLALLCDAAALGSFAVVLLMLFEDRVVETGLERLLVLVLMVLGQKKPTFAIPWIPLAVMVLTGVVGLFFLLQFSQKIGRALLSKELPRRLKSFIIWTVLAVLLGGAGLATRMYLDMALQQKKEAEGPLAVYSMIGQAAHWTYYGTLLLHVTLVLFILMKYLGLLGLGSDEAQKRANKWRPARA